MPSWRDRHKRRVTTKKSRFFDPHCLGLGGFTGSNAFPTTNFTQPCGSGASGGINGRYTGLVRLYIEGWQTTQLYRDFNMLMYGSLLTNQDSMERIGGFAKHWQKPIRLTSNWVQERLPSMLESFVGCLLFVSSETPLKKTWGFWIFESFGFRTHESTRKVYMFSFTSFCFFSWWCFYGFCRGKSQMNHHLLICSNHLTQI